VRTSTLAFDPALSPQQNGARLHAAVGRLVPGDELRIGPGTWSVAARFDVSIQASAARPVWIVGDDPTRRPVLTRPDAQQNVLNLGSNAPCRYLVLRDLELTGGGDLLRVYDVAHLWLDRCYLHDGNGVGFAAQTHATTGLHLTHNEIARPGPGTNGEGMYLGAGTNAVAMTDSVIAFNHVHDLRGARAGQGDGIELKQGCARNWIVGNTVHGARNPCLLLYGAGGQGRNVVERNLLYDSDDAVLQVQGEALVRNNVVVGGSSGFQSHDHQGATRDLALVHNTIVSVGRAAHLARWGGRPGMLLANNVLYSLQAEAVHFGAGSSGVRMVGNIALGSVFGGGAVTASGWPAGFVGGGGLGDFVDLDPRTLRWDATPVVGGMVDNRGDPSVWIGHDQLQRLRTLPADPGARTNAPTLVADRDAVPAARGGAQRLTLSLGAAMAGAPYVVLASASGTAGALVEQGFHVPLQVDWLFDMSVQGGLAPVLAGATGALDGAGGMQATVTVPPLPAPLVGLQIHFAAAAWDGSRLAHVSNPVPLRLQ